MKKPWRSDPPDNRVIAQIAVRYLLAVILAIAAIGVLGIGAYRVLSGGPR